jgi:hypothetical protein
MPRRIDLTGQHFGKLEITAPAGTRKGHVIWAYRCECGNTGIVRTQAVRYGRQVSCGCAKHDPQKAQRASMAISPRRRKQRAKKASKAMHENQRKMKEHAHLLMPSLRIS